MTDKYKEQPAFETNEFKVGDQVRVYGYLCPDDFSDGTVTCVKGVVVSVDGYGYSFRQCRLLKKREPEEYWLVRNCKGLLWKQADHDPSKPADYDKYKHWKKVREVLE